ncbi:hypothetical protein BGZ94_005746, partial [Podila epigama]
VDGPTQDANSVNSSPSVIQAASDSNEFKHPHFRTNAIPVASASDSAESTVCDVTIQGHAACFYIRGEKKLIQRAIDNLTTNSNNVVDTASNENGGVDTSSLSASHATGSDLQQALSNRPTDPILQGHFDNVCAIVAKILKHRATVSKAKSNGQDNEQDQAKSDPQLFYGVSQFWLPVLTAHGKLTRGNYGVKFVISERELLNQQSKIEARCQELEQTHGLVLGTMVEKDIAQMLELNSVKYDEDYGHHIIKRSACFRTKEGVIIAWGGSHSDFAVAALHVLPEYRKLGLGKLVLWHLGRLQ